MGKNKEAQRPDRWNRISSILPNLARKLLSAGKLFLGGSESKRTGKKWDTYRAKRRVSNRAARKARMVNKHHANHGGMH